MSKPAEEDDWWGSISCRPNSNYSQPLSTAAAVTNHDFRRFAMPHGWA